MEKMSIQNKEIIETNSTDGCENVVLHENEIANNANKKNKLNKKIFICIASLIVLIVISLVVFILVFSPMSNYSRAQKLFEQNDFEEAAKIYEKLDEYKESKIYLKKCNHMILYNYILKHGEKYEDIYTMRSAVEDLFIQVKENDNVIRVMHTYQADSSSQMNTILIIDPTLEHMKVSYLMTNDTFKSQAEATFKPQMYTGEIKFASDPGGRGALRNSDGTEIGINDLNECPYLEMNSIDGSLTYYNNYDKYIDAGRTRMTEEWCTLRFYVGFPETISCLNEFVTLFDVEVDLSDLGVNSLD